MCILFLSYEPEPSSRCPYLLVAANNRDEYYHRPTAPARFWERYSQLLAGRDLEREEEDSGSWLGVSKSGRFSVLTNYRVSPAAIRRDVQGRGPLVRDFLVGASSSPLAYSKAVLEHSSDFNGFSLITADLKAPQLAYCTNSEGGAVRELGAGVYGLSNQLLDSPWRKVEEGKAAFSRIVATATAETSRSQLTDSLFHLLSDNTKYHPDPNIPWPEGLTDGYIEGCSSIFVEPVLSETYGTRTSTVVLVDRHGGVSFTERTMVEPVLCPTAPDWSTATYSFSIDS